MMMTGRNKKGRCPVDGAGAHDRGARLPAVPTGQRLATTFAAGHAGDVLAPNWAAPR